MKKLPLFIVLAIIAISVWVFLAWRDNNVSLSPRSSGSTEDEEEKLWLDTVMYAEGHAFGYSGDISMWEGWYIDTVFVGDDYMLRCDSAGPSKLKLSLITRHIIVDFGDSDVIDRVKNFMNPIPGFRRFRKQYEECCDSIYYDEGGLYKFMGGFSFEVDYPDSCNENAGKIFRFIGELTGLSENEKAKSYRPVYKGNASDMQSLSDFLAREKFDNWRESEECSMETCRFTLAIRPHIANERYVTFSMYEYERQGSGHGMYTETFHTFDMKDGKELVNSDIFKSQYFDEVKMKLFEVMAEDSHYLDWHNGVETPEDVERNIFVWQSPNPIVERTEGEDPENDNKVELPEGALTDSGVVFSFQPYEIDCWAAGTYHFIVPFDKLMPYLTPKAKSLIGGIR